MQPESILITGFGSETDRIKTAIREANVIKLVEDIQQKTIVCAGPKARLERIAEARLQGLPVFSRGLVDVMIATKTMPENVGDFLVRRDEDSPRKRKTGDKFHDFDWSPKRGSLGNSPTKAPTKSPRKSNSRPTTPEGRSALASSLQIPVSPPIASRRRRNSTSELDPKRVDLDGEVSVSHGLESQTLIVPKIELKPVSSQPQIAAPLEPVPMIAAVPAIQPTFHLRTPKSMLGKVIAFEGNIGAGKSTLARQMRNKYGQNCSIYEETTNEGFLKLFYSNPAKYGFAFQWGMLKTRIFQLKLAQYDTLNRKDQFNVWDRSMIGDHIFALWNHLQGSISKEEMKVYESEFGGSFTDVASIDFLKDIHMFVFLNDEPAACKRRVEGLRQNDSESGIPLSYYEGIDDIHFSIFLQLIGKGLVPSLVLNWKDYDDAEEVVDRMGKILSGKRSSAKLGFLPALPHHLHGPTTYVYKSEEDVMETYRLILSNEVGDRFRGIDTIYLSENMMKIPHRDKGVINDHYNHYKQVVVFYKNEYKRVLLYHLAMKRMVQLVKQM